MLSPAQLAGGRALEGGDGSFLRHPEARPQHPPALPCLLCGLELLTHLSEPPLALHLEKQRCDLPRVGSGRRDHRKQRQPQHQPQRLPQPPVVVSSPGRSLLLLALPPPSHDLWPSSVFQLSSCHQGEVTGFRDAAPLSQITPAKTLFPSREEGPQRWPCLGSQDAACCS